MADLCISSLAKWGTIALAGVMTLIQITPIKINPWSWLAKKLGQALNGELLKRVDKIEKNMNETHDETLAKRAVDCRYRILRFGDELRLNVRHSKEYFDQVMDDITNYDSYCASHKKFQNSKTPITIELIKETYKKCLKENDFL